ncbi:MAG: RluA family pseudouridine synthase [Clostridia bacterium]|nr:RluA family pseudouridine synthase [Clostridia bacterium]
MEVLIVDKEQKLSKLLMEKFHLSYSAAKILIKKKNIKVNGKRVSDDQVVCSGDKLEIFGIKEKTKNVEIVFEDSNILVANKPAGVEVCDGDEQTLDKMLAGAGKGVFAVHRIDRNTTGLVVFAKNLEAKKELEQMFKTHAIKKFYLAEVVGKMPRRADTLVAYLKKVATKSIVFVSDSPKEGYSKIITKYRVLSSNNLSSLLEVEIETGKTHQIRAHLAHVGHALVGDDKYGNKQQNNQFKKHKQQLVSYKLVFENPKGVLEYLKGKVVELDTTQK